MRSPPQTSKRVQARNRGIADDWKSGNYTVVELADLWGLSVRQMRLIFSALGIKARDKQYRDRRILQLYREGRTKDSLAERFGLCTGSIYRILRGEPPRERLVCRGCGKVFTKSRPGPQHYCADCADVKGVLGRATVWKKCPVCGEAFPSHRGAVYCSNSCSHLRLVIGTVERGLRARELRRNGKTQNEIAFALGLSQSTIARLCAGDGPQRKRLAAIEIIRRHRGRTWLSGLAKAEKRQAERTLKEQGLYHYFCIAGGR